MHLKKTNPKMSITFFSRKKEYNSLSNFSEHPVVLNEIKYYCGEVCFQAQKFLQVAHSSSGSRRLELLDWSRKISVKTDPILARRMGRQFVLTLDELSIWNKASIQVQTDICKYKFENYEEVRSDLRKSGDMILIHPCRCSDEAIRNRVWEGRLVGNVVLGGNMLGKIWMEFRSFL